MQNKFRKSPQVDLDLDSIWSFIAADNVRAANKQIDHIGEVFAMLIQNPMAGRQRSELRKDLRSFAAGNYIVFYLPLPDGIEVVRVLNGRQNIDTEDLS